MVDLAAAIAPECEHEIIGIRPGEKIHEVLIPGDEAEQTLEFDDFFVVRSAFQQVWGPTTSQRYAGELGKRVEPGFDYRSDNNPHWMKSGELCEVIDG
jgi:UDP-N-acetylglucosamine 4,6-dehydratase/5-epimerase